MNPNSFIWFVNQLFLPKFPIFNFLNQGWGRGGKGFFFPPLRLEEALSLLFIDRRMTVVQNSGRRDGIPKVLFGIGRLMSSNERASSRRRGGKKKAAAEKRTLIHWLQKLLLLDAVSWTGRGRVFQLPLTR